MVAFFSRLIGFVALVWCCGGMAWADDPPDIFPQLGHSQAVADVAYAPDGSMLASAGADNNVILWDVASGREFRTLPRAITPGAISVAFAPQGGVLALGRLDGTIELWDVKNWHEIRALRTSGAVFSVAFSPDGHTLAAKASDGTIRLWNWTTGDGLGVLARIDGFLNNNVVFSPNGALLAARGADFLLRVWDVASLREVRRFRGRSVGRIAFSPDGGTLVSGTSGDAIGFWNVATGRSSGSLRDGSAQLSAVAVSPNGHFLASNGLDNTVRIFGANGQQIGILQGQTPPGGVVWAYNISFSPDSGTLAICLEDGSIRLWDTAAGKERMPLASRAVGAQRAVFSPDGRTFASASFDHTVKLWDAATGHALRTFAGLGDWVPSVAFSPDGRWLAAGSNDSTAKLWDVASGATLQTFSHQGIVNSLAFSPDGRILATGSGDHTIKLWDPTTGALLRTLTGHTQWVNALAFSPDGHVLASGSGTKVPPADNSIRLWDVGSGRALRVLNGHAAWVTGLAFSPDGTQLASSSEDRTIKLWDPSTGSEVKTVGTFQDRATGVAFSPDGHTLGASAQDNSVKLWDMTSGRELHRLEGHGDMFGSVAFSPDGRALIAASWNGALRLWDAASGTERVALAAFKDGSWLAITPEGYYDTSSDAAEQNLNVRIGDGVFPIGAYREKFFRPDLVRLSLAGRSLAQLGFAGLGSVKVAPIVSLDDVPLSANTPTLAINVQITDGGGGVGQVRLFLNGTAVVDDTSVHLAGAKGKVTTRGYVIHLATGSNSLRAVAFNADNSMQSNAAVASTYATLPVTTRGNLHALVVGIQEFKNQDFSLKYSSSDARFFADTLRKYSASLFDKVDVKLLTTAAETTRDALMAALKAMQTNVGPDDLFVFYVASHGLTDDGDYYLITSNVGSVSTEHLKSDAITKEELTALVANIPATKKLMVIDTCHAAALGDALGKGLATRGLDEATALKILSRAVGTTVLAASTSTQQALEGYEGHGLFTYVVAEGLMGKGDVNKDGFVSTFGLAHYVDIQVPELAEQHFHRAQYPTIETSGQEFPLTKVQ